MASKTINFKNWLRTQKILFKYSTREKDFLQRAYERITIDKEPNNTKNFYTRKEEFDKKESISDNSKVIKRL